MADFTLSEILSRVASLTPPGISTTTSGKPVMQSFNCLAVQDANTEFNNKFGVLMSYWEPFQMIINTCSGNEDGSTPNSFNARVKQCANDYPCSNVFGSIPAKTCTFLQTANDVVAHTNCWTAAYNQYESCVSTGMNNNSLSYYKDKILESLDAADTAYNKLQAAIRVCGRTIFEENQASQAE